MKLECPYCWQHYDIERKDINQEFTCISCAQAFKGKDALVLEDPKRARTLRLTAYVALLAAVVALAVFNVTLWRQLHSLRSRAKIAAQAGMSETEKKLAAVQAASAALEKRLDLFEKELTARSEALKISETNVAALEKRLKDGPDVLEELVKIRTAQGELLPQLKKLEQQDAAVLKGLADFRTSVNSMNLANRIGELEKFAHENEIRPLAKRLSELEAKVKGQK